MANLLGVTDVLNWSTQENSFRYNMDYQERAWRYQTALQERLFQREDEQIANAYAREDAQREQMMMREDSAIQRQVADSRAAGVSPLANMSGAQTGNLLGTNPVTSNPQVSTGSNSNLTAPQLKLAGLISGMSGISQMLSDFEDLKSKKIENKYLESKLLQESTGRSYANDIAFENWWKSHNNNLFARNYGISDYMSPETRDRLFNLGSLGLMRAGDKLPSHDFGAGSFRNYGASDYWDTQDKTSYALSLFGENLLDTVLKFLGKKTPFQFKTK